MLLPDVFPGVKMFKRALAAGSASFPAWELSALTDPLAGLRGREGGEKRRGRTTVPGRKGGTRRG